MTAHHLLDAVDDAGLPQQKKTGSVDKYRSRFCMLGATVNLLLLILFAVLAPLFFLPFLGFLILAFLFSGRRLDQQRAVLAVLSLFQILTATFLFYCLFCHTSLRHSQKPFYLAGAGSAAGVSMPSNSTSKMSIDPGSITGGAPRSP